MLTTGLTITTCKLLQENGLEYLLRISHKFTIVNATIMYKITNYDIKQALLIILFDKPVVL